MARKTKEERRINAAPRGNVPLGRVDMGVTVNMGDYNSVHVATEVSGIDISSPEATKRELETGAACIRLIYEFVDTLTGKVLNEAMGEERAGEFQATFLRHIVEAQRENGGRAKK